MVYKVKLFKSFVIIYLEKQSMESISQFEETPLKSFKGLGAQLVRDKTYCVGFSTNPGAETFFKYCQGVTVFPLGAECLNMSMGN